MTTPVPQPGPAQPVPPFDTGNPLLGEQPANLTTALVQTPLGQRLALTVRTASTTATVFLAKADADTWAANIKATADQMSGAGLIVAPGNGMPVKGQG